MANSSGQRNLQRWPLEFGNLKNMGPIGMPELFMLFIILPLLVLAIGFTIWIIRYLSRRGNPTQVAMNRPSLEARLAEIDDLKSKNLITDAEHQEKRKQIISSF